MNPRFIIAFLLLCCVISLSAQTPKQLDDIKLFEAFRYEALVSGDFEATEKMIASDLIYTHSNTAVEDKAAYMSALRTRKYDFQSFSTDSTQYRMLGKKTVVATGNVEMELIYHGKDIKIIGRFTAIYVKRDRRWQLQTWQTTKRP